MCMCVFTYFKLIIMYYYTCKSVQHIISIFASRLTHLISSYFTATIFFEIGSIIMLTLLFVHKEFIIINWFLSSYTGLL